MDRPYVRDFPRYVLLPGASPGANTAFTVTDPFPGAPVLVSLAFTFTADANVADRSVRVEWVNAAGVVYAGAGIGAVITASTTARFRGSVDRGTADWDSSGFAYFPLPRIPLYPSFPLQINVTNMQATDALSAIMAVWELDEEQIPHR